MPLDQTDTPLYFHVIQYMYCSIVIFFKSLFILHQDEPLLVYMWNGVQRP
jgi:hypothetical protein